MQYSNLLGSMQPQYILYSIFIRVPFINLYSLCCSREIEEQKGCISKIWTSPSPQFGDALDSRKIMFYKFHFIGKYNQILGNSTKQQLRSSKSTAKKQIKNTQESTGDPKNTRSPQETH